LCTSRETQPAPVLFAVTLDTNACSYEDVALPYLAGIRLCEDDLRRLVASLIADAEEDALHAAAIIGRGLDRGTKIVPVTSEDRRAILRQLEETLSDGLAELRGVLMREIRA
jgi:hypothetical protein